MRGRGRRSRWSRPRLGAPGLGGACAEAAAPNEEAALRPARDVLERSYSTGHLLPFGNSRPCPGKKAKSRRRAGPSKVRADWISARLLLHSLRQGQRRRNTQAKGLVTKDYRPSPITQGFGSGGLGFRVEGVRCRA